MKETLNLVRCAAKLQLVPLTRACSRSLEMMLAPECVAEVWEASHAYQLDRLKTRCLRFIIDNYDLCRPEKEPSIRGYIPCRFHFIMCTLASGPAANSRVTKLK